MRISTVVPVLRHPFWKKPVSVLQRRPKGVKTVDVENVEEVDDGAEEPRRRLETFPAPRREEEGQEGHQKLQLQEAAQPLGQ